MERGAVDALAVHREAFVTDVEGMLWSNLRDCSVFERRHLPEGCVATGVVFRHQRVFVADQAAHCVWALNVNKKIIFRKKVHRWMNEK